MSEQVVTEGFVRKVCSFFMERNSCRGYDLTSPIGRIADRAFKHWMGVERKEESIRKLSDEVAHHKYVNDQLMSHNRQLEDDLNYCKKKLADARDIFKNMYKVKWDETDPLKWDEPSLGNKVIHKERVFSAESLKEAQEIANHSFHLCQFNLYRYDEELGDFDEEHNLQFAVEKD